MAGITIKTWDVHDVPRGARVLVRIDGNVLFDNGRRRTLHHRLLQTIPEIQRLLTREARIILATHRGEPDGINADFSSAPIAHLLGRALKRKIAVADDVVGPSARAIVDHLERGEMMMLENLRFEPGEAKNRVRFARQLAALADVYVNNAFGVCHRAHASVDTITRFLPSFAGELVLREIVALTAPRQKPFALVVGGIKLATKIPLLRTLGAEADIILLGSALYPHLATAGLSPRTMRKIIPMVDVRKDARGKVVDIGPKTERVFLEALRGAQTVVWNGPLGIVERADGRTGTRVVARSIAASGMHSIVGGGDTVEYLASMKLLERFSFVSTGGGAMLAFLAGEPMPGLRGIVKK